MEMQQMMELLLAKTDTTLKEVKDEMLAKVQADREGMTARLEAIHDQMDASKKKMKEDNNEKFEVLPGTKDGRKERTACQKETKPNL
jgi:hypothetical protein